MLIILATQDAKIRRIMVRRQPRQIVREPLSQKNKNKNKNKKSLQTRAGGLTQSVGCEFKSKYCKKRKSFTLLGMEQEAET
jgi:hypothetical protein